MPFAAGSRFPRRCMGSGVRGWLRSGRKFGLAWPPFAAGSRLPHREGGGSWALWVAAFGAKVWIGVAAVRRGVAAPTQRWGWELGVVGGCVRGESLDWRGRHSPRGRGSHTEMGVGSGRCGWLRSGRKFGLAWPPFAAGSRLPHRDGGGIWALWVAAFGAKVWIGAAAVRHGVAAPTQRRGRELGVVGGCVRGESLDWRGRRSPRGRGSHTEMGVGSGRCGWLRSGRKFGLAWPPFAAGSRLPQCWGREPAVVGGPTSGRSLAAQLQLPRAALI